MANRLLPVLLSFISVSSCSLVKENRDACPCQLRIRANHECSLVLSAPGYEAAFSIGSDTTLAVPRGMLKATAVSGATLSGEGLTIPYGYDCPPVWLYSGEADTSAESASLDISLRKHYCTLTLTIEAPPGWGEPYWVEVHGPVNGIDPDGKPRHGDFSCRLDRGMSVRLPRQGQEDLLTMDIVMPDRILRRFSLGNYILSSAYDWNAPDLGDMDLSLTLSVTAITLTGGSFTETIPMDIVI